MTRPAFLIGAGASAYCHGVTPNAPPLGEGLFAALQKYDVFFRHIPQELTSAFEENFERGMQKFCEEASPFIGKFLRLMGLYFLQFKITSDDNEYIKLLRGLKTSCVFATLNYDCLLEDALTNVARTSGQRPIKLHGSPTYIQDVPVETSSGNTFVSSVGEHISAPVRVTERQEAIEFCQAPTDLAPAMSVYAPGKHNYFSKDFIVRAQTYFQKRLAEAPALVINGVAYNEADAPHLWDGIKESTCPVGLIDPAPQKLLDWFSDHGRKNVVRLAATFEEAVTELGLARLNKFLAGR